MLFRSLVGRADVDASQSSFDTDHAHGAFLDWYAARHDDLPETVANGAGTILAEWGPPEALDERSFYACSPHRVEMAGRLIRQGYIADYATEALQFLPDWVQWCIERSGLDGETATRSREAARSAAAVPVADEYDERPAEDDEAPFRRHE